MTVNQPLLLLSRAALPDLTAIVPVANNHHTIRARSKKLLPPSHLLFFTIFHWQKEASWQGACKNMFAISQAQQCTSKCRRRGVGREKALSYYTESGGQNNKQNRNYSVMWVDADAAILKKRTFSPPSLK